MKRSTAPTTESEDRTRPRRGAERDVATSRDPGRSDARRRPRELQRRLGNAAVQRLAATDGGAPAIQRMCGRCRRRVRAGKPLQCTECEAALQRTESASGAASARTDGPSTPGGPPIAVNDPNDRFEREAEAVASAVVGMSRPEERSEAAGVSPSEARRGSGDERSESLGVLVSERRRANDGPEGDRREPSDVQRVCDRCSRRLAAGKPLDCPECESKLQRRSDGSGTAQASDDVADQLATATGRGRPLPGDVRSFFEPRFDSDFGDVRIHTGTRADELSRSLGARAFTHGRNVFFANGEYRPAARSGRRLLAHELTHTIQQGAVDRSSGTPTGGRSPRGPAATLQRAGARSESSPPADRAVRRPTDTTSQSGDGDGEQSWAEWGYETTAEGLEWTAETGEAAAEWGVETATASAGAVYDAGETAVVELGAAAVEVADGVWDLAQSLEAALGGELGVHNGSIVLTVSDRTLGIPMPSLGTDPPEIGMTVPFGVGGFSVGPLTVTGTPSLSVAVDPALLWEVGSPRIDRFRLELDPLGGSVRSRATVALPTRLGLDAQLRASVGGSVQGTVVLPTTPPLPIAFPSVGLRGELGGHGHGTVSTDLTATNAASASLGNVSMEMHRSLDAAVDADFGLSGAETLELAGMELCRHHWPLWTKTLTGTVDAGAGFTLSAGLDGFAFDPDFSSPQLDDFDVSDLGRGAEAELVHDDCWLCRAFRQRDAFASPADLLPYHMHDPDDRLRGPLEAYPTDPGFASGALCRGACGPDCRTCEGPERKTVRAGGTDGASRTWVYEGFYDCPTHGACRRHDACFDWAAAEHGETDWYSPAVGKKHAICNLECYCNHSAVECGGFLAGFGGEDRLYFAEAATLSTSTASRDGAPGVGGGAGGTGGSGRDGDRSRCPKPTDVHSGMRIHFPDKSAFATGWVHEVSLGDPSGHEPDRWYVEYVPTHTREQTSRTVFSPAYDASCTPRYVVPETGADDVTFETETIEAPSRRVGDRTVGPRTKASFVEAYPLRWTTENPPRQEPMGWSRIAGPSWVRAHLVNGRLSGPGVLWNLVPAPRATNRAMKDDYELDLVDTVRRNRHAGRTDWFAATVTYYDDTDSTRIGHFSDFVDVIEIAYGPAVPVGAEGWDLLDPAPDDQHVYDVSPPDREDLEDGRVEG